MLLSVLSVVLMTADHRTSYLNDLRAYLSVLVFPLHYLASAPVDITRGLRESFKTRDTLQADNQRLRDENLTLKVTQQRMDDLAQENARLRRLLLSSRKTERRVMIADVLSVDLNPFVRKLVIDKGSRDDVKVGFPLLDTQGVLGQVEHVNALSSTVILITDPNHILPIQLARNGLHGFAEGTGAGNRLSLLYLPNTADVKVGDKVVTSGLGEKFPPGYPVGVVDKISSTPGQAYMEVEIIPGALLDRNREILLVWPDDTAPAEENTPKDGQ